MNGDLSKRLAGLEVALPVATGWRDGRQAVAIRLSEYKVSR